MKPTLPTLLVLAVLNLPALAQPAKPAAAVPADRAEFFEKRIRPVLVENCQSCHGDQKQRASLRLDSRAALLKGGENGPAIVPGDPDRSRLIQAVRHASDLKMPPKKKLPAEAIAALTAWVKEGAPWPDAPGAVSADPLSPAEARSKHWAFRPVQRPALPPVKHEGWVRTPVDRFVLARLEQKGYRPAPPANRPTLLRRVTFDLIGLPPTPEEIDAAVSDKSPDWYEKVVDRLLASPHYGERWGRHWLDVARYADTKGYVFTDERRFPFSYTYRDWVIRSLNEDLPYDQFLIQQLAADQLPLGDNKRPLAAMGFLTLGRRFLNNPHDIIDDRIDVVCRGLMGLTVGCARCHDHKYDPISQKDYYALHGVFASSVEPKELPVIMEPTPSPAYRAYEKELSVLQKAVEDYREAHKVELAARNRKHRDELRRLQKKVDQLRVTHPGAPPQAMVLVDAPQPVQPHVFRRGNPNNPGEAVPRQFLEVLSGPDRKPFAHGSGRLELGRAIASKDNPLTARVLVNRVWMHHFGHGLVWTPGNFGLRGDPPTHPELLDWMAAEFTGEPGVSAPGGTASAPGGNWSVKKLHRLILLSNTYRQSCDGDPRLLSADPDNRLLGRMNRRRLDFESLRDSLLAASGRLDLRAGGRPVDITTAPFSTRRTVYGFIDRQNLPGIFRTFDLASPDTSTPQRFQTTVPQQALFLMNSPFVQEQARHLIARPEVAAQKDAAARVRLLYRVLCGRPAEAEEVELGVRFVAAAGPEGKLTPWERYAQVLLLSNEFAFVD